MIQNPANFPIKAKYLGVWVGRMVTAEDLFCEALKKYTERIGFWYNKKISVTSRIMVFNVFILPVLGYLMQFFMLPKKMLATAKRLAISFILRMPAIPFNILTRLEKMWNIKPGVRDISILNIASILRVLPRPTGCGIGEELCESLYINLNPDSHWKEANKQLQALTCLNSEQIVMNILPDHRKHYKITQAWWCSSILKLASNLLEESHEKWFDQKILRWNNCLDSPLNKEHTRQHFKKCSGPNYCSLTHLRFLCNAWPTKRRYRWKGGNGPIGACTLCGSHEDSIEGFTKCSVLQQAWTKCVNIPFAPHILFGDVEGEACGDSAISIFLHAFLRIHNENMYSVSGNSDTAHIQVKRIVAEFEHIRTFGSASKPKKIGRNPFKIKEKRAVIFLEGIYYIVVDTEDEHIILQDYWGNDRKVSKSKIIESLMGFKNWPLRVYTDGSGGTKQEEGEGAAGWGCVILGTHIYPQYLAGPTTCDQASAEYIYMQQSTQTTQVNCLLSCGVYPTS